jgi:hypothetical protein
LNVTLEGLPAGMTFQTLPMTADRTEIPVVFTATADAPLDGTLTQVIGRPADANLSDRRAIGPADDAGSRAEQRRCVGPRCRSDGGVL